MFNRRFAVPLLACLAGWTMMTADTGRLAASSDRQANDTPRVDRLTLETYLEMETVGDPQLSPDGTEIVYTRGWIDKMNDRRESALWIMNADGSRNRFLAKGTGARWSPSGDRIAYVASGDPKGSQIFVRWMDAQGATSQVTRVDETPSSVAWSPDGTQLSFNMLVEDSNTWSIKLPKPPSGAKWTAPPHIVERLNYRSDRTGFTDSGYRHIFVVPAIGGTPRALTTGNFNHTGGEWTPDGRQILFSGLRSGSETYEWRESEIYAVDVVSGAIKPLTTRQGPDMNPSVSPDGRLVAYTGNDFSRDTDGAGWYYNFEKLPWEDPSEHLRRSPLTYVGNVKTPTMLMTGVNDLRTPMPQTEQFYSALKLRNVPTAMLRFNNEWHGTTTTPSNFMRTQLYLRYWFEKYKRGGDRKPVTTSDVGR